MSQDASSLYEKTLVHVVAESYLNNARLTEKDVVKTAVRQGNDRLGLPNQRAKGASVELFPAALN
jgi:hypothetical protein